VFRKAATDPAITRDEVTGIIAMLMKIDETTTRTLRELADEDGEEEEEDQP
jgi:hypothetical protein